MYNTAVLMVKVHMGLASQYLGDLLNRAPARYGSNNYDLPRTPIDLYELCILWLIGLELSPPKMKTCKSVRGFKVNLRKILFNKGNNAESTL